MKNQILAKLARLKKRCENENRDPSTFERAEAKKFLEQIDEIDSRAWFEQDEPSRGGRPSDAGSGGIQKHGVRQKRSGPFKSDGGFYQAVMRAGMPNGQTDRRLYQIQEKRAASGLSESTPSDGGFLVDTEMTYDLVTNLWASNEVLRRIKKTTLTGNKTGLKENLIDEVSRQDGYRSGGILSYWKGEADLKTSSKPKFRQNELNLNKLIGLCYATDELLDDAPLLAETINEGFQSEFDFKITNAIINGTGAGQPLGIIPSGCVVSVDAETGQAANSICWENIKKAWARLLPGSHKNAVFLINANCQPELMSMHIACGTGGIPVYLPGNGAASQPYGTLMGRPVIPIEQCPVLGDTGDLILADLSGYRFIDKGSMQRDVSIHVRFIYDESVFRFVYRADGQPVLSTAITPFTAGATTASDTLSHFVKIAAR